MNKKALKLFSTLLLAITFLLAACGGETSSNEDESINESSSEGGEFTFNLGHALAPDNHYQIVATKFAELVEEKTNGSITIDIFPQSQLGGEVQMIQATQSGSQEMLIVAQAPLTNMVPEWLVFDLPYLFEDYHQANSVLSGEVGDRFLEMLPDHDLIGLGWTSAMERSVFASSPIETVEDFQGFKVRVIETQGYVESYEALGAQPTPMAYSEVYSALQQGVVDGAETGPEQFFQDGFNEVADYYNRTKVHHIPAILAVSKQIWDQLSSEQQTALQEASEEALTQGVEYYDQSVDEALVRMEEEDIQVINSDLSGMEKQTEAVYDSLLGDIPNGEELLDMIQQAK